MIYRKICSKSGHWYLRLPRIADRISWQSSGRCGRPPDVVMPPIRGACTARTCLPRDACNSYSPAGPERPVLVRRRVRTSSRPLQFHRLQTDSVAAGVLRSAVPTGQSTQFECDYFLAQFLAKRTTLFAILLSNFIHQQVIEKKTNRKQYSINTKIQSSR